MRTLFYASNGFGLGHLMRTLGIARALRRLEPTGPILFVTNSEGVHLAWKDEFPALKLLSRSFETIPDGQFEGLGRINLGAVAAALQGFDPDVIAVDFFPLGRRGDLIPIRTHRARKALIAREPNPAQLDPELALDAVEALYDLVILPHRADEGVALPKVSKPVRHVGPILVRSRGEALDRKMARRTLGLPTEAFLVYVGFGGGGRRDVDLARDWVLQQARRRADWTFAFARPPLFRGGPMRLEAPNVVEFTYAPLAECWPAFDLAVSSLSFNSTMELLHHGVPTVFVEMPEKFDDWSRRGRMIAGAGAGLVVKLGDSAALGAALDRMTEAMRLAMSKAAAALVPDNGAERAARLLLELGTR